MVKRYFFLSFFIFCISPVLHGQEKYSNLTTALKKKSSADRVRYLTSHILQEVKGSGMDSLHTFLNKKELYAREQKDTLLRKFIHFFKQTQSAILEPSAKKRAAFYRKKVRYYQSHGPPIFYGICLHYLSQNQFVLEKYGLSFENSLHAQKIFKKIGLHQVPNIGKYLHDLALNYYFFRDYKKVVKTMKESIQFPKFSRNLDIQRYNTLGMAYLELEKSDSAKVFFDSAMKKATHYEDTVWIGIVSGNIGEVFMDRKAYNKALPYFLKNYQLNKKTYFDLSVPRDACTDLAMIYLALDSPKQAYAFNRLTQDYFPKHQYLSFGEQQQFEKIKKQYYDNFYHYYLQTGHYKKALLYRDSLERAKKLIRSTYNKALIKISQDKVHIQEKKTELSKLRVQSQLEVSHRNQLIILVVVLLIGTGGILLYRNKRLIHKQKVKKLELKHAHEDLNHAKKRLDILTEKIKKNNQLIQKLQSSKTPDSQQVLQELQKSTILTKNDWKQFQALFARTYPGFLQKLRKNKSHLTPAEQRCLCLEKLKLSNNEMATVLGISSNSIMVTKHRIRKKLQLENQKDLEIFVQKI